MADAATIALLGTMPAWQAAHWVCMFTGNLVRCSQERLCLKEGKNINILSHFFRFFFRAWNPKRAALHRVKAFPSPTTPPPPSSCPLPHPVLGCQGTGENGWWGDRNKTFSEVAPILRHFVSKRVFIRTLHSV